MSFVKLSWIYDKYMKYRIKVIKFWQYSWSVAWLQAMHSSSDYLQDRTFAKMLLKI